jgi:hypothetical protein
MLERVNIVPPRSDSRSYPDESETSTSLIGFAKGALSPIFFGTIFRITG